ncbi:MAG: zinc finger domain-containing protein [Halobacteriota archaeon]
MNRARRSERMEKTCISCGTQITRDNAIAYPYPPCREIIAQCKRCKKLSNPYRCSYGFGGP